MFFFCRITFDLHEPNAAANKSVYCEFQAKFVQASFFVKSYWKNHRGRRLPSCSRYSSAASSQYLKSTRNFSCFCFQSTLEIESITLSDVVECILIDHTFDDFQRNTRRFRTSKFRHIIALGDWNSKVSFSTQKTRLMNELFDRWQRISSFDLHLFWQLPFYVLFLLPFALKIKQQ